MIPPTTYKCVNGSFNEIGTTYATSVLAIEVFGFLLISGIEREGVYFGLLVLRNDVFLGSESLSDVEKNMVT